MGERTKNKRTKRKAKRDDTNNTEQTKTTQRGKCIASDVETSAWETIAKAGQRQMKSLTTESHKKKGTQTGLCLMGAMWGMKSMGEWIIKSEEGVEASSGGARHQ